MTRHFSIIDSGCKDFERIERAFTRLIEPVYGNQVSALQKIATGHDRLCEGLYVDNQLQGMLVYKKQLTPNNRSLEIKTLALIHPNSSSGKGLGSVLFERAMTVAAQRQATHLALTVSSKKSDALGFFQKKGFQITESIKDRYSVGAIEHTLSYKLPTHQHTISQEQAPSSSSSSSSSSLVPSRISVIPKKAPKQLQAANDTFSSSSSSSSRKRSNSNSARSHREESVNRTDSRQAEGRFVTPCNDNRTMPNRGRFFDRRAQQHQCNLKDQYVRLIENGQKTYEGRVSTNYFKDYNVGDTVTWSSNNRSVTTKITSRTRYNSFDAMLLDIGYKNMVPDARSHEHAVSIYNNIPGYREKATRFGVIAMGVEVCEPQHTHTASNSQAPGR
ncbi:MAG: GNAT family N-acetyltransferase [Legionella sp.]|nr:GNAT family N-acetyltransferase [Legionella sp.]